MVGPHPAIFQIAGNRILREIPKSRRKLHFFGEIFVRAEELLRRNLARTMSKVARILMRSAVVLAACVAVFAASMAGATQLFYDPS